MPFGIHKHSNRSKQALSDSSSTTVQDTVSAPNNAPSASSSTSNFATPGTADEARTTQTFNQQPRADQPYAVPPQVQAPELRAYQNSAAIPARSQSTRYPSGSYPQQPPLAQAVNSADDLTLDSRIQQQQQHGRRGSAQVPVVEQKKSKSLFDRMRSSKPSAPTTAPATAPSYDNTAGLARRLSKRQENSPVIRTAQQKNSLEQQQRLDWQSAQGSRSHLPSPQEGNEDGELDPYLVRDSVQDSSTLAANQPQTIRPVQSDSESPQNHAPSDTARHYHQQTSSPVVYQQPEGLQQGYQQQTQDYQQHITDPRPGSLLLDNQFRYQNADSVSQLSYDSPVEQREEHQRPNSGQSNGPSPTSGYSQQQEYPSRSTSVPQGPRPLSQQIAMAPSTGASQQTRRSADAKQTLSSTPGQGDPPPSYNQQFPRNQPPTPSAGGASPLPPPVGQQGPGYRGGPPQREQFGSTGGEQGRSTPPPAPGERGVDDAYKELLQKYKKVKGLYFDKNSQVEQLQNTLANQRLSQSRTSLDDSEYMTRFQRLDGATTNLAFNIRKDWKTVPSWIAQHVNQDALKIGKQEMTGVGRACITRFLVDEIFQKTFHPGLETDLSRNLKSIEQNIRHFSPTLNNQEESDALTAKVVQWRLATLDGLRDVLGSPESEEHKKQFARIATTNLTANLMNFLAEPAPAGIEDSAHMIVELAVSIASNLPVESRDISIIYPLPGDIVQPFIMKTEAGIPALENPGAETNPELDASSTGSGDKDDTASKESEKDSKLSRKDKTKSSGGMLQAMMGGSAGPGKKGAAAPAEISEGKKASAEDGTQKVRFAGFVGVEVRGRQILSKAPIWTVGS